MGEAAGELLCEDFLWWAWRASKQASSSRYSAYLPSGAKVLASLPRMMPNAMPPATSVA